MNTSARTIGEFMKHVPGTLSGPGVKPEARRVLRAVVLAVLVSVAIPATDANGQNAAQRGNNAEGEHVRTLMVSGRGQVRVRPDEAIVRLGVEAQSEDAATAQANANAAMEKTMASVKELGIDQADIQTAGLTLSPIHAPRRAGRDAEQVIGYRASNVIRVRTTDLGLVGKVIDVSLEGGANRLEGVHFGLAKQTEHQARALKEAAQDARTKAHALAEALDLRLGGVHKVHEGALGFPMPRADFQVAEMAMPGAPTPVAPGELEIEASVMLEYIIESASGAAAGGTRD
jgi:uncharacterized protein